jgi:SAM-dependent methyltransferase
MGDTVFTGWNVDSEPVSRFLVPRFDDLTRKPGLDPPSIRVCDAEGRIDPTCAKMMRGCCWPAQTRTIHGQRSQLRGQADTFGMMSWLNAANVFADIWKAFMSAFFYKVFYGLGAAPWERLAELPAGGQLRVLIDREEEGRQPPYGPALDLGCGTGGWSIALATRGWQVTGVDIVSRALRTARKRAADAGVDVQLLAGDVADLGAAGAGYGYRLILDIGTVHGIPESKREATGRAITAVAAPDATLLMYAFRPERRGPLPRGMSRAEIEATYPGWRVTDEQPFDLTGIPESTRKDDPRWYRLSRVPPGA